MPGGSKSRTAHKRGSKKRHLNLRKEVPQISPAVTADETVATAAADVVKTTVEARHDRNGLDPDPSSGDANRVQAEEEAASSSSARSSDRDGSMRDRPATECFIVELGALNRLFAKLVCRTCSGKISVVAGEQRECGLATKLCLVCSNCGVTKTVEHTAGCT